MFIGLLSLTALLLTSGASATLAASSRFGPIPLPPKISAPDSTPTSNLAGNDPLPPYNTWYYFDQLIDHNDPSAGTFVQRYYHTWEYYQPGT